MRNLRNLIAIVFLAVPAVSARTAIVQAPRAAQGANVFCVHGGVGLWPSDQVRPYYAVAVVDINMPAAATSMLTVSEFTLLSETNLTAASLSSVENIDQLAVGPPSPLFATYLNPPGVPVTSPLPAGPTRIRVRVRLDRSPQSDPTRFPTHYRMTLTGIGVPLIVTGKLNGEWPT